MRLIRLVGGSITVGRSRYLWGTAWIHPLSMRMSGENTRLWGNLRKNINPLPGLRQIRHFLLWFHDRRKSKTSQRSYKLPEAKTEKSIMCLWALAGPWFISCHATARVQPIGRVCLCFRVVHWLFFYFSSYKSNISKPEVQRPKDTIRWFSILRKSSIGTLNFLHPFSGCDE